MGTVQGSRRSNSGGAAGPRRSMEPDEPGGAAQQRPPLGDDSLTERFRRRLQRRSWRGSDGAELENWLDATAVGVTQRRSVAALSSRAR